MISQKFLTTGQMAKLLSVTPDTVLKWIKRDKLPALRTAGGHYFVLNKKIPSLATFQWKTSYCIAGNSSLKRGKLGQDAVNV